MKKFIISGLASALLLGLGVNAQAKSKLAKIYVFGFAASFNDSTVYFTDIQRLDTACLDSKSGFLLGRNNYSNQLRDYLSSLGKEHRTCIISFDKKEKKVQKKLNKMVEKYARNKKKKKNSSIYNIKFIDAADFRFKYVAVDDDAMERKSKVQKTEKSKNRKNR